MGKYFYTHQAERTHRCHVCGNNVYAGNDEVRMRPYYGSCTQGVHVECYFAEVSEFIEECKEDTMLDIEGIMKINDLQSIT